MTKNPGGRPPFYGSAMRSFHLKLTAKQRDYCQQRGGASWVRELIEAAWTRELIETAQQAQKNK